MKPVRYFRQWFWRVGKAKHSRQACRGEHRQSIGLIMPERFDRVRLCALQLSDLVFILNVMLWACEMSEPLLENGDLALVDIGLLHLRQGVLGEVLERGAIELGACPQGRCRQVQRNAGVALDLREGLELFKGRNVDMKHCGPLLIVGPDTHFLLSETCWPKRRT